MPTLAIIGIILFVVGYLIPAAIEIYEKAQAKEALDDRVSLFSIRADWFTAFSALAIGRMRSATRPTLTECMERCRSTSMW